MGSTPLAISTSERWVVRTTRAEPWPPGEVELNEAGVGPCLRRSDREPPECPAPSRKRRDRRRHILVRTGAEGNSRRLFYRGHQQCGTAVEVYDDVGDCPVGLLQAQADRRRECRGEHPPPE